jgi:hypothetical protein
MSALAVWWAFISDLMLMPMQRPKVVHKKARARTDHCLKNFPLFPPGWIMAVQGPKTVDAKARARTDYCLKNFPLFPPAGIMAACFGFSHGLGRCFGRSRWKKWKVLWKSFHIGALTCMDVQGGALICKVLAKTFHFFHLRENTACSMSVSWITKEMKPWPSSR